MTDRRQNQKPYRGPEKRQEPYDYARRRDQKIVNFALLGLMAILAAAIADVGNAGLLGGMATLLVGLLAVPKFLEWDESRKVRRGEDR